MSMKKAIRLPASVMDEIERRSASVDDLPEKLNHEDRDAFIRAVPKQFQTEAEEVWHRTMMENERRREEWFQRAVTILAPILDGTHKIPGLITPDRGAARRTAEKELLTTKEAAEYLHRSASWLAKQNDIPYIRGIPNLYQIKDLDAWIERHKKRPKAA